MRFPAAAFFYVLGFSGSSVWAQPVDIPVSLLANTGTGCPTTGDVQADYFPDSREVIVQFNAMDVVNDAVDHYHSVQCYFRLGLAVPAGYAAYVSDIKVQGNYLYLDPVDGLVNVYLRHDFAGQFLAGTSEAYRAADDVDPFVPKVFLVQDSTAEKYTCGGRVIPLSTTVRMRVKGADATLNDAQAITYKLRLRPCGTAGT